MRIVVVNAIFLQYIQSSHVDMLLKLLLCPRGSLTLSFNFQVFDKALDGLERSQIMYMLAKKWELEKWTDSDGDGVLDYLDPSPAPEMPNV